MNIQTEAEKIWLEIISEFLDVKASESDITKRVTRATYRWMIKQIIDWMMEEYGGYVHPDKIRPPDVRSLIRKPVVGLSRNMDRRLKDSPELAAPAVSTQKLRLAVLAGLYDVAIYREYTQINPASVFRRLWSSPKDIDDLDRKTLTHEEREKFFQTLKGLTNCPHKTARNLAIFKLFEATGLRRGGMDSLNLEDINFTDFTLKVTEKGNKIRTVPILDSAHESLLDWVHNHRPFFESEKCPTSALWIGSTGKRVCASSIGDISHRCMKKCGFNKIHFGPHLLRHTFVTDSIEQGADIRDVAEIVGHVCVSTTQIYDHSSKKIILERFRKARNSDNSQNQNGGDL
ncbi:MAG TPA: tyrosine-type recombinase/integrase [Mariprofundaceae bacterium]|nr:tyrosine-type recombinase/integrase [Mariprofundaceae bacterium]